MDRIDSLYFSVSGHCNGRHKLDTETIKDTFNKGINSLND